MIAKALAVLLLAALTLAGVQTWRLHRAQLASADSIAQLAQLKQAYAEAQTAAATAARQTEAKHEQAMAAQAAEYERQRDAVSHVANAVIDDLRADNLRLRDEWQGCTANRVPATATSAGRVDDAAELRANGAGRLVQSAAACDAQVAGLQAFARTCSGVTK